MKDGIKVSGRQVIAHKVVFKFAGMYKIVIRNNIQTEVRGSKKITGATACLQADINATFGHRTSVIGIFYFF